MSKKQNKRQRKKKNILGVNTNSNGNIMIPTEHLSIMSAQFGVSTNQPKYSQHIPKRSVIKQSSLNLKIIFAFARPMFYSYNIELFCDSSKKRYYHSKFSHICHHTSIKLEKNKQINKIVSYTSWSD